MFKAAKVSWTIDSKSLLVYHFPVELSIVHAFALLLNFRKFCDFFMKAVTYGTSFNYGTSCQDSDINRKSIGK